MNMTLSTSLQIIVVLLTGLLAGLFYGYDCSVIGGLGQLHDKNYLLAFQSINKAILNPYFFLSFMGSLILLPLVTFVSYKNGIDTSFYFLLTASVLYTIGVVGITMLGNVPLNNLLNQVDLLNASENELLALREKFESSWNSLHQWRTYASISTFVLCILSLSKK